MTTLTVNLLDSTSIETALRVLGALSEQPALTSVAQQPAPAPAPIAEQPAPAPAPAPTPVAEPTDEQPDPQKPDIYGLVWNDAIHSNPPRHNSDGSWRVKRGKKDEYEAAIAAATAPTGPAEPAEPAQQPMLAASEPTAPQPLVEYETMSKRFIAMMDGGKITDFQAVYVALGIDYTGLATNQTMIERLWHYMDAIDNGDDHNTAVRHAMGS